MDANGQLTFTRASGATRVGPNGYIEKVRTNLLLQSNTFSTTWATTNGTSTSGQTGYDGTNNAWLLTATSSLCGVVQTISQGGMVTQSVYAKAGTASWIALRLTDGTTNNLTYADLTNRVFGVTGPSFVRGSITDVGSGWSRISVTINQSAYNQIGYYVALGSGNLSTTNETIYIQDAQLEAGDVATDYIPTTTAAVSVGPVSGLPRLDYYDSTCPKLLLEPQRTNSLLQSDTISTSNWGYVQCSITSNVSGPDGYNSARRITNGATANDPYFEQSVTTQTGFWTWSIFVKQGTAAEAWLYPVHVGLGSDVSYAQFNFATKTFANVGNIASAGYETHADGWYRIWCSVDITSAVTSLRGRFSNPRVANVYNEWAFPQLEFGAYPSSLIPTLGTSVTRVADDCVKTSATSIIGQTEGVIFINWDYKNSGSSLGNIPICLDGGLGNEVYFYVQSNGNFDCEMFVSSVRQFIFSGSLGSFGTKKIAIAYKQNDFALYINGVQIGTDTSGSVPAMNRLYVGRFYGNTAYNIASGISEVLLFKTRLTNAQLAELTTL
jgi:hypothetical protein